MIDRTEILTGAGDAAKVQRVDEVLARLPPRYRAVLELRFLRRYTIDETAQGLGITSGYVKVMQHRALAKAVCLADIGTGSGSAPVSCGQAIA